MKKLVLVRHGESEWNKLNLFTGWTDVELSETGKLEASDAGKELLKNGYDFDICYTSYLKRAIHTLEAILTELDRSWLPVYKSWKLNERHYGALQGLNKTETVEKYGEEQVKAWRRSYDVPPPPMDEEQFKKMANDPKYKGVNSSELPKAESLEITCERVVPFWEETIKPQLESGKRVLVVAHGNSIRALMKHLENISNEEITGVNIPTGVPLVYEFDDNFTILKKFFVGDISKINDKIKSVQNQTSKK